MGETKRHHIMFPNYIFATERMVRVVDPLGRDPVDIPVWFLFVTLCASSDELVLRLSLR